MFLVGNAIAWARKELGSQQSSSDTLSEDEAKAAMATANGAIRDGAESIASAIARTVAPDRTAANARKQAFYDAMYLIAGSDGAVSPQEKAKLVIGLRGLLGESFDEVEVDDGLEMGRVLVDERGVKGAAAAIAEAITDAAERSLLLTMASVSAWLGGGVGTKEGLALQALAAAFEIPINKLHEAMNVQAAAALAKTALTVDEARKFAHQQGWNAVVASASATLAAVAAAAAATTAVAAAAVAAADTDDD